MQANCKSVLSHQFVDFYCNVIVDYFIQHVKFATAISGVEIFIQHAHALEFHCRGKMWQEARRLHKAGKVMNI